MWRAVNYISTLLLFSLLLVNNPILSENVSPVITDPKQIEAVEEERQEIFNSLIDDPTNLDNLFKYANLSIILGDLEAAISVFEQMLIYEPDLPRIRLELGVLYFRLNAYPSAKLYLSSVKKYDPPEEVLKKVESFLEAIVEADSEFQCRHTIGMGLTRSSNANAGIDADFIEIAGFPLLVSEDSKTQGDITKNFRYSYTVNQDLKHPRGDTVNYIFSLTDERLAKFDRFDMSTAVISINRIFNLEENSFFSRPFINTSVTGFMVLLADKALLSSQQYRLEFGSALSDQHFLSIGSYYDKRNFLMNDSKSGHINGLNLTNSYITDKYFVTELKYDRTKFNAKAAWEHYLSNSYELRFSKQLSGGWAFNSSISHSKRSHSRPAPVFGIRKDEINSFKVDFSKPSSDNCLVTKYSLSKNKNRSTIDIYERSNLQASVDLNYLCLTGDSG